MGVQLGRGADGDTLQLQKSPRSSIRSGIVHVQVEICMASWRRVSSKDACSFTHSWATRTVRTFYRYLCVYMPKCIHELIHRE
jgi:hypothetical protein